MLRFTLRPRIRRSCWGRFAALVALGLFAPAPMVAARDKPPELVSTERESGWASVNELRAAAEAGDPQASMELGVLLEIGHGGETDPVAARRWYLQAAAGGVPEADFRLGRLFSEGIGGPADLRAAFDHYLRAAYAGIPLAQYNVGASLASARGVRRNYVEGLAWIILASRDPEVDPSGQARLRERLARRPQDIAAAERRAEELRSEVEARMTRQNAETDETVGAAPAAVDPKPVRPELERPEIVVPPIRMNAPPATIPVVPLPPPPGT